MAMEAQDSFQPMNLTEAAQASVFKLVSITRERQIFCCLLDEICVSIRLQDKLLHLCYINFALYRTD